MTSAPVTTDESSARPGTVADRSTRGDRLAPVYTPLRPDELRQIVQGMNVGFSGLGLLLVLLATRG